MGNIEGRFHRSPACRACSAGRDAEGAEKHALQKPACLPRRLSPRRRQVKDPARLEWHEVTKVAHYYLSVNAMTRPMQVREGQETYGDQK